MQGPSGAQIRWKMEIDFKSDKQQQNKTGQTTRSLSKLA